MLLALELTLLDHAVTTSLTRHELYCAIEGDRGRGAGKMVKVKAKYDDHGILVKQVVLPDGLVMPAGTHGFVLEAFDTPVERYEIGFFVEHDDPPWDDLVLAIVGPDDFGVA